MSEATTGMPVVSTRACSSAEAPAVRTPPPARITGRLAAAQQSGDLVQTLRPVGFECLQVPVLLTVEKAVQLFRLNLRPLDVHGNVQQYRAGPAALSQVDGLFQVIAYAGRIDHQFGIFGQRLDHTDDIRFLETDLPDRSLELVLVGIDLAGDEQAGYRIKPAAADAGDHVQGAGAAGGHGNTEPAVYAGIGLGGKGAGLFMVDGDTLDVVPVYRGVEQVRDGSADEFEDVRHSLTGDEVNNIVGKFHDPPR